MPVSRYLTHGMLDRQALQASIARALPEAAAATRRARVIYRYDPQATSRRAAAVMRAGGTVAAVRRPIAARVVVPVLRQAQRNTCESAALQVLLASAGRNVDQRRLQVAFPRSGPPDPAAGGIERVWGDPDLGYVGRPDGGGTAGGFGIYPAPVQATARRFGVPLKNLTGKRPAAVYKTLLRGRAVMAWIGLSDGPYGQWRSPQGRDIKVNFGEHTVVLYGLRQDGRLEVSNPLRGTRELWTRTRFEAMWQLLGRRALAA